MNTTITKLEKRMERLEKAIRELLPLAEMSGALATDKPLANARKLLGEIPDADTSDPCPICGKPFKTCGHF